MSAFLGVCVGLVAVMSSYIIIRLAIDMEPTQGMMLVQIGFLLKLSLSAIFTIIIVRSFPHLDAINYGLGFGLLVCIALPTLAITQTRK